MGEARYLPQDIKVMRTILVECRFASGNSIRSKLSKPLSVSKYIHMLEVDWAAEWHDATVIIEMSKV